MRDPTRHHFRCMDLVERGRRDGKPDPVIRREALAVAAREAEAATCDMVEQEGLFDDFRRCLEAVLARYNELSAEPDEREWRRRRDLAYPARWLVEG